MLIQVMRPSRQNPNMSCWCSCPYSYLSLNPRSHTVNPRALNPQLSSVQACVEIKKWLQTGGDTVAAIYSGKYEAMADFLALAWLIYSGVGDLILTAKTQSPDHSFALMFLSCV